MITITNTPNSSDQSNGNGNGKKPYQPEAVYEHLDENQWVKSENGEFSEVIDDIQEDANLIDYYDDSTGNDRN